MAIGFDGRKMKIWDFAASACVATLEANEVHSLAALDGRRMASGSLDRTVKIWELATVEYDACPSSTVIIWELATGACGPTLKGQPGWRTELRLRKSNVGIRHFQKLFSEIVTAGVLVVNCRSVQARVSHARCEFYGLTYSISISFDKLKFLFSRLAKKVVQPFFIFSPDCSFFILPSDYRNATEMCSLFRNSSK